MLAGNPALTVTQVKTMLRDTAQEWGAAGQDPDYGWGRLDAWAAVKRAGNFPGSTAPTVPMHQTFTGRITTTGAAAEHTVSITDASYPLAVTLIMPDWTGSNSAPPPPPGGQHEVIRTGRVTAGARDANVTFNVREQGYVDLALGWAGAADRDFYVYAPDGTFIGRAHTINNPERFQTDTVRYGTGAYRVRVNLYSGAGVTDTLRLYVPEAILC